MKEIFTKRNLLRVLIYVLALVVLGIGIATIVVANFGRASQEALMAALEQVIGKTEFIGLPMLTILTFLFGVLITFISFAIKRDKKLFLNIIAVAIVSLSISLGLIIWKAILPASGGFFPTDSQWLARIAVSLLGITLLGLGAGVMLLTNLPVSPIDRFVTIMSDVTGKRVAIVKIVFDLIVLLLAFMIFVILFIVNKDPNKSFWVDVVGINNPNLNVVTVLTLFLIGPVMDITMKIFSRWLKYSEKQKITTK